MRFWKSLAQTNPRSCLSKANTDWSREGHSHITKPFLINKAKGKVPHLQKSLSATRKCFRRWSSSNGLHQDMRTKLKSGTVRHKPKYLLRTISRKCLRSWTKMVEGPCLLTKLLHCSKKTGSIWANQKLLICLRTHRGCTCRNETVNTYSRVNHHLFQSTC